MTSSLHCQQQRMFNWKVRGVKSPLASRNFVFSHFPTCPSFWPYLASVKISRCYIKRFKVYRVDKRTAHAHKQTLLKTIPPSLRYDCASGNQKTNYFQICRLIISYAIMSENCIFKLVNIYGTMLCIARTVPSQDVCPSSVTRRHSIETAILIIKLFHRRVATPF